MSDRSTARLGVIGRFLVPLDEPRVAAWFFAHLLVPHGRRERLLRPAAGLAVRLPGAARRSLLEEGLFERVATGAELADEQVTAPGPEEGAPRREPSWAEALASAEWLLGGPGRRLLAEAGLAGPLTGVIAADYAGSPRRRTLLYLFPAGAAQPAAVAKLRPAGAAGAPLADEREALLRARGELPAALAATVPAVLAWGEAAGGERAGEGRSVEGRTVEEPSSEEASGEREARREGLLLEALPGRSAWADLHARMVPSLGAPVHFAAAAGWLARFHAATRRTSVYEPPPWSELGGAGEAPPAWYRRLRARLAGRPLALAAGHGDYWPRNLLLAGHGAAAVVDWEAARPAAPPFVDLFTFPWTYALGFPWRRGSPLPAPEAFHRGFLADNPLSRSIGTYLTRYGAALDLDGPTLRDLFRLWLRLEARRGGDPWTTCERMLGAAGRSAFSG